MKYEFADVLVARAGSRVMATEAGTSGRRVEDEIEAIAQGQGLPYAPESPVAMIEPPLAIL